MKKIYFVLVVVFAVGAGGLYLWQRPGLNESPANQFIKMFGDPISYACTHLIFGAYNTHVQAEKIEQEAAQKDPAIKAMLAQVGDEAKSFLFKNKEIHQKIVVLIQKTPLDSELAAMRTVTPQFIEILASQGNLFYSSCEDIYLKIFLECKDRHSNPQEIQQCFNTLPQQSDDLRNLYQNI